MFSTSFDSPTIDSFTYLLTFECANQHFIVCVNIQIASTTIKWSACSMTIPFIRKLVEN